MAGSCLNDLKVGCRVWTEFGLTKHGHQAVNVPAQTGGTLKTFWDRGAATLYEIKWDTGQTSVHYFIELYCIGHYGTDTEYKTALLANGERVELTLGPQGGLRGLKIFLCNGDWVDDKGLIKFLPQLEAKGISVKTEKLQAKPRFRG